VMSESVISGCGLYYLNSGRICSTLLRVRQHRIAASSGKSKEGKFLTQEHIMEPYS
jgi:hypothetical protein